MAYSHNLVYPIVVETILLLDQQLEVRRVVQLVLRLTLSKGRQHLHQQTDDGLVVVGELVGRLGEEPVVAVLQLALSKGLQGLHQIDGELSVLVLRLDSSKDLQDLHQ
jgi:hypothetical protein